jgi:hypothetical protein
MSRTDCWFFTINNYTQADIRAVLALFNSVDVILGCAEFERSPTGTPHIQGFVHLNHRLYLNQIMQRLGRRAHCESTWGDDDDCFAYCSKFNAVFVSKRPDPEPDTSPADLVHAAQTLSAEQFVAMFPAAWLAHRLTLERLMLSAALAKAQVWNGDLHSKNLWLWGIPKIGKSTLAQAQSPITSTLRKNCDLWWDGYSLVLTNGVIVENYPAAPLGDRMAEELEKWGDRFPFVGQIKGSTLLVDPGRFTLIVTSHYAVDQCFSGAAEREAIKSRFQEVEMTVDNCDRLRRCRLDRGILTENFSGRKDFPPKSSSVQWKSATN